MRKFSSLLAVLVLFSLYAFDVLAQAVPAAPNLAPAVAAVVASPIVAPVAAPVAGLPSFLSAGLIAMVLSIVACLNIALSSIQQIFAKLSKSEPGWLQSI